MKIEHRVRFNGELWVFSISRWRLQSPKQHLAFGGSWIVELWFQDRCGYVPATNSNHQNLGSATLPVKPRGGLLMADTESKAGLQQRDPLTCDVFCTKTVPSRVLN